MGLTQDTQGGKAETHKGTRVMMEADRRAAGPAKAAGARIGGRGPVLGVLGGAWTPELWENRFLLFKATNLWSFVRAARADCYRPAPVLFPTPFSCLLCSPLTGEIQLCSETHKATQKLTMLSEALSV